MTDPWLVQNTSKVTLQENSVNDINTEENNAYLEKDTETLGFEDSFLQDSNLNTVVSDSDKTTLKEVIEAAHKPLPDSETYLQSLERKLKNLKKNSNLVDALSEKRADCLRSMVQDISSSTNNDQLLELETSIINPDSAVQNLYRQLQPIQPITVGETVQIVKYDQLEEQRLETEAKEERL